MYYPGYGMRIDAYIEGIEGLKDRLSTVVRALVRQTSASTDRGSV